MDPNNQQSQASSNNQPNVVRPTTNMQQNPDQTPNTVPTQPALQGVNQENTPYSANVQLPTQAGGTIDKHVLKNVRYAGISGIMIGIALIIATLAISISVINLVFGVIYIILSIMLILSSNIKNLLKVMKILTLLLFIQIILSLIGGGGVGVVPMLIFLFIIFGIRDMHKAGYISSATLLKAKPLR